MDAKIAKIGLGPGGMALISKPSDMPSLVWEIGPGMNPLPETLRIPEMILLSTDGEYVANLLLDWHYNDIVDVSHDNLWMLLTTRHHPTDGSRNPLQKRGSSETTLLFGLLVKQAPLDGEFFRVGVWGCEAGDLGGPQFWDGLAKQCIRLV